MNKKQELRGTVSLAFTAKSGAGILAKGTKVKITASNEVGPVTVAQDFIIGEVLVPNKEDNGQLTVLTRGRICEDYTTGAAYAAGSLLNLSAAGKAVIAAPARASGTITVVDNTWDGGETITVNGVTLTETTDFANGASAAASALNLCNAINAKVPGVIAKVSAAVVTVYALDAGVAGNAITLAKVDGNGVDFTLSGATLTGGIERMPAGIAIEASTNVDQTKKVLWF